MGDGETSMWLAGNSGSRAKETKSELVQISEKKRHWITRIRGWGDWTSVRKTENRTLESEGAKGHPPRIRRRGPEPLE